MGWSTRGKGSGGACRAPPPAPGFLLPAASACGPYRIPKPGLTFDSPVESRVQQREFTGSERRGGRDDAATWPVAPDGWALLPTAASFSARLAKA